MRIAILYNFPSEVVRGTELDLIADQDIIKTVRAVESVLKEDGHTIETVKVDNNLYENLIRIRPDFVFNLAEGFGSNDLAEPYIPAILEMMGLPYTGSGPLTLSVALDKSRAKQILSSLGIPTPRFHIFSNPTQELPFHLRFPLIVKPIHEDASIGITNDSVVGDEEQLRKRIAYILETYRQHALVEEYIDGREFNVSIMGNRNPVALPIEELEFRNFPENQNRICSYSAKWIPDSEEFKNTVPVCPANIPKQIENRIKRVAIAAYKALECQDYARIDLRLDSNNNPYVLEVNPNPDIGPEDTAFSRAAQAGGLSYSQLIRTILSYAVERHASIRRAEENPIRI